MQPSDIDELIIFGAGGHAITVSEVAIANNPKIKITFVGESKLDKIFDHNIVPNTDGIDIVGKKFISAVGDNLIRKRIFNDCISSGMAPCSIISRQAYIGQEVSLGKGVFVGNGCIVGGMAEIGDNCILNTHSEISHEVRIGKHSQVAPSCVIGGKTMIGENVFAALGSVIIDRLKICDDVIVGANSTVIRDITQAGTFAGSPVRKIK